MRLYIMRHAEAVPRGTQNFRDAQRPLTPQGQEQSRYAALALQRLEIPVGSIVSSPLVRATQTAEGLRAVLGHEVRVTISVKLLPETDPRESSQALEEYADEDHLLVIGHQPHLGDWISYLLAGPGPATVVMKKGGIAGLELDEVPPDPGSASLRWLMTLKQLSLIARAP